MGQESKEGGWKAAGKDATQICHERLDDIKMGVPVTVKLHEALCRGGGGEPPDRKTRTRLDAKDGTLCAGASRLKSS